ncbi:MAG: dipeptide ABC transporter ATP-binding protein [Pseudoclavibacter sp.]
MSPENQATPLLAVDDLRVRFVGRDETVTAVESVSFEVGEREILAVVGESGSGKTVTSMSVMGLLADNATVEGSIRLEGKELTGLTEKQRRNIRGVDVAMVFQDALAALNPAMRVGAQIVEAIRVHDRSRGRRALHAEAVELLRKVGIPDPERRALQYPHEFSGGMRQRAMIAMALSNRPRLLIADEPTTALDVTVQAEILELLRSLRDELGMGILIITHNMGVVADLADRVVVMRGGAVVEEAPVLELFERPTAEYTRSLLHAVPRIGATEETAAQAGAEDREVVVSAKDIEITYSSGWLQQSFTAVRGVNLELRAGEILGLVGESGSGKTTIGRAIGGLQPISGGSLSVLGHDMAKLDRRAFRPVRRDIGFVFQDPGSSFNPLLTIAQNVAEPLIVHERGIAQDEVRARVDELLEAVQLTAAQGRRLPHELSGGQKQRASLARALILRPRLVIADEPTSALDVSVQARVLELFDRLHDELGFACLFVSHDLAVVDQVADRIAVLLHGELVEAGSSRSVLTAPQADYTQRLLSALPVPDPVEQKRRRLAAAGSKTPAMAVANEEETV